MIHRGVTPLDDPAAQSLVPQARFGVILIGLGALTILINLLFWNNAFIGLGCLVVLSVLVTPLSAIVAVAMGIKATRRQPVVGIIGIVLAIIGLARFLWMAIRIFLIFQSGR